MYETGVKVRGQWICLYRSVDSARKTLISLSCSRLLAPLSQISSYAVSEGVIDGVGLLQIIHDGETENLAVCQT